MLRSARERLEQTPSPRRRTATAASANPCAGTGYAKIVQAVQSAARVLRGEPPLPPGPEPATNEEE